jgi:Zn-finger nucleic acid-binding protein
MAMNCPNCSTEMTSMTMDAHLSVPIVIDLCTPCQAFWFDKYESLKLSAASILQLMKLIGEHSSDSPAVITKVLQCPRCSESLHLTNDMQRATRFSYWKCAKEHGKFMRFLDFLKEKNFIRPMPAAEIEELKKNVRTVNCSNCGAPIDLATSSACTHCGSAISMLDMNQAQETLAQLQKAAVPRPIDPALPFELEMATRDAERSFGPREPGHDVWGTGTSSALVQEVLDAVSKWLTRI